MTPHEILECEKFDAQFLEWYEAKFREKQAQERQNELERVRQEFIHKCFWWGIGIVGFCALYMLWRVFA